MLLLPLKSRYGADLLLFGVSRLVTCVVMLAFGAPTGRFHSFRKMYPIFYESLPLLQLNVLDRSCCNRSNFDFEPLQTNSTRLWELIRSGRKLLLLSLKMWGSNGKFGNVTGALMRLLCCCRYSRRRSPFAIHLSPSDAQVVGAREVRRGETTCVAEGNFIEIRCIISES